MTTVPATPHEEDALGKAYDARLVRRLLVLVRPYRRYAIGSVLVLLVESFFHGERITYAVLAVVVGLITAAGALTLSNSRAVEEPA